MIFQMYIHTHTIIIILVRKIIVKIYTIYFAPFVFSICKVRIIRINF